MKSFSIIPSRTQKVKILRTQEGIFMATKKFPETFPQKVLEEIQFIDEALHIVCQRDFF